MVSQVEELINWRKRLVERGLDKGVASALVAGLERLFVGPEDIDKLNRRLERAETMLNAMRLDLTRAHEDLERSQERQRIAERETADLRRELREERRAARIWR